MAILGLSISSRIIATAAITNNELLDYGVKLFTQRWSYHKAEKIVNSLSSQISKYAITSIALTIPYAHYQSKETEALIAKIKAYCRKKKIRLLSYHPTSFHAFCPEAKAKKKGLMKCLVGLYPELGPLQKRELRNRREYYHKLFEAVAAASLYAQEVRKDG